MPIMYVHHNTGKEVMVLVVVLFYQFHYCFSYPISINLVFETSSTLPNFASSTYDKEIEALNASNGVNLGFQLLCNLRF